MQISEKIVKYRNSIVGVLLALLGIAGLGALAYFLYIFSG